MDTHQISTKRLSSTPSVSQEALLKAEVLATLSHELRSPLTSIQGYAETLLRNEGRMSPEERHECLLAIADASTRLDTLIARMLELSQLETNTIHLEPVVVDLVYLAREAVLTIEERLEQPNAFRQRSLPPQPRHFAFQIHVERDKEEVEQPILAVVDRYRMREVLDHLLENAVLYSPSGGLIEVGLHAGLLYDHHLRTRLQAIRSSHVAHADSFPSAWQLNKTGLVELWVRDRGRGIAPEHLEIIFERFLRLDTGLTREVNGLGLGLTLCQRIIELHHGVLWAQSTPGEGSTFHMLLPA